MKVIKALLKADPGCKTCHGAGWVWFAGKRERCPFC